MRVIARPKLVDERWCTISQLLRHIGRAGVTDCSVCWCRMVDESYEAAAIKSGVAGVRVLARHRSQHSIYAPLKDYARSAVLLSTDAEAHHSVETLVKLGLASPIAAEGMAATVTFIRDSFGRSDYESAQQCEQRQAIRANSAMAALARLPLLALVLRYKSCAVDEMHLNLLHDRMENARLVCQSGSVKAELVWYANEMRCRIDRKSPTGSRALSERATKTVKQEWHDSEAVLPRIFAPPSATALEAIINEALKTAGDAEIERLKEMICCELADAETIVSACIALSPQATRSLEIARSRLTLDCIHNPGSYVELWAMSPEVSRIFALEAASRLNGSRASNPALDQLAADLFSLHARLVGRSRFDWDVRNTRNVPSGEGYHFVGHAFRLFKLPWSDHSGHVITRAKVLRAAA